MTSVDSRVPYQLAANGKKRTEIVRRQIHAAMRTIEVELKENGGIYPFNSGRLSRDELCRRAGVGKPTLKGPAHKRSTLVEVNDWLAQVKAEGITGSVAIRKTVTSRAEEFKKALTAMGTNYLKDQLKLIDLEARIRELERENETLRQQLASASAGRVVAFPTPGVRS